MINGNRFERKGTLAFNLYTGSCTVLNQVTIVLCFDENRSKLCHQSNTPLGLFTNLPNSTYGHAYSRIASFDGKNVVY